MKTSYKVSLLAAVAICILVIAYYAFQHGSGSGPAKIANAGDNAQQPVVDQLPKPRPTLGNTGAGTGSESSTSTGSGSTGSGSTGSSSSPSGEPSGNQLLAQLHQMQENANSPGQSAGGSQTDTGKNSGQGELATKTNKQTLAGGTGSSTVSNFQENNATDQISSTPTTPSTSTPMTPVIPQTPSVSASENGQPPSTTTPTTSTPSVSPTPSSDTGTVASSETYTIKPGDSFYTIARQHYGKASAFVDIAKANPMVDPTKLQVGQKIKLPPRSAVVSAHAPKKTARPASSGPVPAGSKTYTVQVGDTLSYIARYFYNDPGKWKKIYDANRDKIGPDPGKLHVGDTLIIPPAK